MQLQLPSHIAPHLTSLEWRRFAAIEIEILKNQIKRLEDELKIWENELSESNKALNR